MQLWWQQREVSSSSAKTARFVAEVAEGGSDDENIAQDAFGALQKRVRVTSGTSADTDTIQLNLGKFSGNFSFYATSSYAAHADVASLLFLRKGAKAEDDDDDLFKLMWGTQKISSTTSGASTADGAGSENEVKAAKKRKTTRAKTEKKAGEAEGDADATSNIRIIMPNTSAKRTAAEGKELDKAEALVLQAKQLQLQFEDPRNTNQVTLAKVNSIMDKLESRLADPSKSFLEMIREQGPGCRAETVWQSLDDAKGHYRQHRRVC